MKKLSNTEAELKKNVAYKKKRVAGNAASLTDLGRMAPSSFDEDLEVNDTKKRQKADCS